MTPSQSQIYWRSKEKTSPPPDSLFSLFPFAGAPQIHLPYTTVQQLPSPSPPPQVIRRTDRPDRNEWIERVQQAIDQIQKGALQKVVLARETTLHLREAPDPFQLTAALEKRSEGAALFCVQFEDGSAFLGATPERLFRSSGGKLLVEAVAGTRKKGGTDCESKELARALLSSEKEAREFQFVQDYFQAKLPSLVFSPRTIHQTANVQHLFSQATGPHPPSHSHLALVQSLYPTPALCGAPKQEALHWILSHEPFSRGIYGGVIGWEADTQSEWMVAIRVCSLRGNVAKLYTGTGIVQGSDPSLEWEELEAKLSLYQPIFNGL